MPRVISANFLTCERVLHEVDGVLSAMRIVEIFTIAEPTNNPQPVSSTAVVMWLWANIRFDAVDNVERVLQIHLLRPSGERVPSGPALPFTLSEGADGLYPSVVFAAPFGVIAKEMGLHYFTLNIDNEEVARSQFVLKMADAVKS